MYELEITKQFSGAHSLTGYPGDCRKLHGHNWQVTVYLQATELDEIGIAVDFKALKRELDAILLELDHKDLNTIPPFDTINPTSENMARTLYRQLAERLNDGNVKVTAVKVAESDSSCATYFEE